MEQGGFWGMKTMNQCLVKFVKDGVITPEEAEGHSSNLSELKQLLRAA
jgi:Tfp pilus assembly pilus retraction ATPase PilT